MAALVIAEHNNKSVNHNTLPTIAAGIELQANVTVLVIGSNCASVAEEVAGFEGVADVICVDHAVYEAQLPENSAEVVAELASNYSHILAPSTTFGKNLLPRVAGLLEVGQISDLLKIIDASTFVRPIYAGNALAVVVSYDEIKLLTVRTTVFEPARKTEQKAPIRNESLIFENKLSRFVAREVADSERPDLTSAKIIISGGRGLQNADNFKLLEQLANQLGAAIGASRAAVDAGFVPNDYQVGQTGKMVAPDLYIAIGISGAIQHIAGIKDSKIIVAINKDKDAPIFAIADYGLVADLFKVLPELQQELAKLGYSAL